MRQRRFAGRLASRFGRVQLDAVRRIDDRFPLGRVVGGRQRHRSAISRFDSSARGNHPWLCDGSGRRQSAVGSGSRSGPGPSRAARSSRRRRMDGRISLVASSRLARRFSSHGPWTGEGVRSHTGRTARAEQIVGGRGVATPPCYCGIHSGVPATIDSREGTNNAISIRANSNLRLASCTVVSDGTNLRAVDFQGHEPRSAAALGPPVRRLHAACERESHRRRVAIERLLCRRPARCGRPLGSDERHCVPTTSLGRPADDSDRDDRFVRDDRRSHRSTDGVSAVGLANGSNPIAIVVPCHRVIGSDNSLTGYGGGHRAKAMAPAARGRRPSRRHGSSASQSTVAHPRVTAVALSIAAAESRPNRFWARRTTG